MTRGALGICIVALFLALSGARAMAADILVFAAASTKTALDAAAAAYETRTDHNVTVAYASSAALARQITQGAPADLFLSANTAWMDQVEDAGHLAPDTRHDLFSNTLVLIARGDTDAPQESDTIPDIAAALNGARLAMALVEAVPAGIYGKAALQHLGQWEALAPHVAQSDSVRAALALVAVGAAPLGIVYGSDVVAEPRVRLVAHFPPDSHPEIRYPIAALTPNPAARDFLAFLQTDTARAFFTAQGFTLLD